jgi:hypothetical protein
VNLAANLSELMAHGHEGRACDYCGNYTKNPRACNINCGILLARRKSSGSDPGERPHRRIPIWKRFVEMAGIPSERETRRARDRTEVLDLLHFVDDPKRQYGLECWEWYGHHDHHYGYPLIWDSEAHRHAGAHRVSWKLFRGKIPKGHVVGQACENFSCTNPRHLLCGPRGEITGRRLRINRKTAKFGDANACSKLTDEDVKKIRQFHSEGNFEAITQVARERGASREYTISVARSRGRARKANK